MRVVIADDHTLVRTGMRLLLETIPGIDVVGEAGDGAQALALIEQLRPDFVIMDLAMPGLNGIEAIRRARALQPDIRVIVLSMHADEAYVHQAIVAGASAYLLKGSDRAELERAIQATSRGERYLTPAISQAIVAALATKAGPDAGGRALDLLTSRQREVLQLVAEGLSTKAIAGRLGLSVKTVEAHRAHIMTKLHAKNRTDLIRYAIRRGIVSLDGPEAMPERDAV